MGNLMTSMQTGVSGLNVSQSGLNTTAHNLANVDTKGYVRQQPLITDFSYNKIGESHSSSMQVGLGTDMAAIRQVRDGFLDKSYRLELGRQGFYQTQYETIQEIEGLFGELEGEAFQETLSQFWVSLQELAKEPDSIAKRATLIQTAVTFTERAENIDKQLNEYQINLNTQILDKVNRINNIGDEIKVLNEKIRQYESQGQQANDYRDSRNILLDQLGEMVKYTYKENAAGVVTVNVEGVQFVAEDRVYHMGTSTVNDDSPMLKPVWPKNGNIDVYNLDTGYSTTNNTDVGSLKGVLVARGGKKGNYTDIPVRENYTDQNAYQEAVKKYNNTMEPSIVMTVQAQFDQLIHGVVTTINSILSPNVSTNDYVKNMGLSNVTSITYSDGTLVSIDKCKLWDEANAPVGMDQNSTGREELFTRKSMPSYKEATMLLEDGSTQTVYVYQEENPKDNYSLFTIGEIQVNQNIKKEYSLIPLSGNTLSGLTGAFDLETCQKLTTAWQTPFATLGPNTLSKNDFSNYYSAMIGNVANQGQVFHTIATNQESMTESIDNKRQEVAGVSSDEELTNMIRYQHAYNAAARYINVIDQMLEHIVTRL